MEVQARATVPIEVVVWGVSVLEELVWKVVVVVARARPWYYADDKNYDYDYDYDCDCDYNSDYNDDDLGDYYRYGYDYQHYLSQHQQYRY